MTTATTATRRRRVPPALLVPAALIMAACAGDEVNSGEATGGAPGAPRSAPQTSEVANEPSPGAAESDMSADEQARVQAAVTAGLERITARSPELAPPALYVGVWDPTRGSHLVVRGEAAAGRPATLEDHFRIGSTTKTLTATVILQLVDEGALALDDTIGTLLPDLAARHPEIADVSVEQLLRMTSRIQDYMNIPDGVVAEIAADPTRVWAARELIERGLAGGILPEGTVRYSTTNFIILQLIAESVEGRPLPESIDARLLGPLGMTGSSLPIDERSLPEPWAAGHLNPGCVNELLMDGATDVDIETDPTDWTISYGQGGGGMTSTLTDLGRWAQSNSGNSYLSQELREQRLVADSDIAPGVPVIYGLGIMQLGGNWYGHAGEAIGWQSLVVHDPETGVSLAFAANMCNRLDMVFWSILNELYPNAALNDFLIGLGV